MFKSTAFKDLKIKCSFCDKIVFEKGVTCLKAIKSGFQAFTPFPTMFSKAFSLSVVKTVDC